MKLGVLSDTHRESLEDLPKWVIDELSGVDLVVHAGDYVGKKVLDSLRGMCNFVGVHGNMDHANVTKELPAKQVFEVKGFKIGVAHPAEGGAPFQIEKTLRAKFENVNIIIYGHTHSAKSKFVKDVLYFNPGSATGAFPASRKSIGIMTIDEKIQAEIIRR